MLGWIRKLNAEIPRANTENVFTDTQLDLFSILT